MSTDGGSVWSLKDDFFTDGGALVGDPTDNLTFYTGGVVYVSPNYVMSVAKTTDGCNTWTRDTLGSAYGRVYSMAIDPSNTNIVYTAGYENSAPAVFKTTDGGNNWSKLTAAGLTGYVYDLVIDPDNTNILYAGTSSNVYKSTDGGANWTYSGHGGGRTQALLIDPSSLDADIIYAGTYNSGVYKSTDAGGSWVQMNDGLDEMNINCLRINPNNYIIAGTNGGSAYRWSIQPGVEEEYTPFRDRLIYYATPNPAIGRTIITYQLPRKTTVTLSIYDSQGRLVDTVENGIQDAGIHHTLWNGVDRANNRVAAGVYFYRLTTEDASYVQKLILLR